MRCSKCLREKPDVRPTPDVIVEGKPLPLCGECWFKTPPRPGPKP